MPFRVGISLTRELGERIITLANHFGLTCSEIEKMAISKGIVQLEKEQGIYDKPQSKRGIR